MSFFVKRIICTFPLNNYGEISLLLSIRTLTTLLLKKRFWMLCVLIYYRQMGPLRTCMNRDRVPHPRGIEIKVSFHHEFLVHAYPLIPPVETIISSAALKAVEGPTKRPMDGPTD